MLFRGSHHSGSLEVELTRRNIPFIKFGGLKFLDAAHTKDMLALLRSVDNPRDRVAGFRVLHLLRGVGPASAQRVLDHMAEAADPIAALCNIPTPPRAGDDWKLFTQTVGDLRYSEWPSDLERARLWYEPHLDRIHEDVEAKRGSRCYWGRLCWLVLAPTARTMVQLGSSRIHAIILGPSAGKFSNCIKVAAGQ